MLRPIKRQRFFASLRRVYHLKTDIRRYVYMHKMTGKIQTVTVPNIYPRLRRGTDYEV